MKYKVLYHRNIKKDLKKLNKKTIDLFFKIIKEKISEDPYCGKRLKGKYSSLWKYRLGDFRISYTVRTEELKILLLRVRHRGCIYDDILF